ncbi:MAG: acyltransferase family protein [Actinomycetota bacterium]
MRFHHVRCAFSAPVAFWLHDPGPLPVSGGSASGGRAAIAPNLVDMSQHLTVDALVDATPETRDRDVDFLRALSIAVVVLWHWVFSITHWSDGRLTMPNPVGEVRGLWLLTWLLQVMPLFFIVGGYANLAGWRSSSTDAATFLRKRAVRLLKPTALYVAVWAAVEVVLGLCVPSYPSVLRYGMVVFVPLWFLGVYLAVVVAVPLTARLHERAGVLVPVVMGAGIVLVDLARFRFEISEAGWVNGALVFFFAHQLGYFWRDGRVAKGAVAVAGLTALVVLTNLGVFPRSMVAVKGEAISNMNPTTACIAALAVFQLGVVMAVRPVLARWLQRRTVWRAVVAANGVAMTVFLWHMTAFLLAAVVFERVGGTLLAEPTAAWWAQHPLWLLAPGVILAGLVAVFARVELPARRQRRRCTDTA